VLTLWFLLFSRLRALIVTFAHAPFRLPLPFSRSLTLVKWPFSVFFFVQLSLRQSCASPFFSDHFFFSLFFWVFGWLACCRKRELARCESFATLMRFFTKTAEDTSGLIAYYSSPLQKTPLDPIFFHGPFSTRFFPTPRRSAPRCCHDFIRSFSRLSSTSILSSFFYVYRDIFYALRWHPRQRSPFFACPYIRLPYLRRLSS